MTYTVPPASVGRLLNFQTTVENLDILSIIKLKYYACRFLQNSMNNDINSGIGMKYMQTYALVDSCSICGIVKIPTVSYKLSVFRFLGYFAIFWPFLNYGITGGNG